MNGNLKEVKVRERSNVTAPRCGLASPCKRHSKRHPFCINSCRNPTSQHLIRDHMLYHYNKMLSAKAAIDSKMPKSRLSSIKLADQQKKEKMRKKIARCEEKMGAGEAVPRSCPTVCRRVRPCAVRKGFLEDHHCHCAEQAQYLSGAACPHRKHCLRCFSPVKCSYLSGAACPHSRHYLRCSCPVKYPRKYSRLTSRASHMPSGVPMAKPPSKHPTISRSRSADSFLSTDWSQRHQESNPRGSSGDLLERHSEYFTKSRKPFTPRTLLSDAKSFLSEYRYYNPAQRMKRSHQHVRSKQHVEAQTQTDTISFPSVDRVSERQVMCEQKITSKAEEKRDTPVEPKRGIDGFPCSILRETPQCPKKSSLKKTAEAEDEELLYLSFIEDVTDEILRLGLFSNRVLDELFESYIEENRNHLDEGKMRQMLNALKSDLGCGQDSETELSHSGQEALDSPDLEECDTLEDLEFASRGHSQKSEDFLSTIKSEDLSLKESNRCESLSRSGKSRETQSRDDFSEDTTEIMDAESESDFCGVEFEEHPDTSPISEAALNSLGCDSDLEVSKELDELEDDFSESLHIST